MSQDAIDRARAAINAAWINSDPGALLAHATDDFRMLLPHEPLVIGKAACRTYLEGFFSQYKLTKADMADDKEVIISGDLAVEYWSYDFESTMVGGDEVFSDQGNLIGVWRRQPDGSWKESHVISNSWKPAT